MSELKTSGVKNVSGLYSFNDDPGAGAIGNIRLGVNLINLSEITHFSVVGLEEVTSLGAATISFGLFRNPSTVVNNNLMTAQAIATFATQPLRGVDLDAAPLRLVDSVTPWMGYDAEIVMAIGAFALTGGRLKFTVHYTEHLLNGGVTIIT